MKKLFLLLVILFGVFVIKSEAKPVDFSLILKLGDPDGKGGCTNGLGICSFIITYKTAGVSATNGLEVMNVTGEIRNNMLVITLPKSINEKGKNKQGRYAFTLSKEMVLEQELAKKLGVVERLAIPPGNYEIKGNTLSYPIIRHPEPGSALPTGK